MPDRHKKTARDVLRVVFRRWHMLVVSAVVFAIAVMIGAHFMPLKYTGTAVFEMGLEAGSGDITKVSQESFDTIRQRLRVDLGGNTAIEAAVEALRLTEGLPRGEDGRLTMEGDRAKQEMIDRIAKGVDIRGASESRQEDVVYVSYTDADPKLAETMPNQLISEYIERIYSRLRRQLTDSHKFIQLRLEKTDGSLSNIRNQLVDFEAKNAGYLPDKPGALPLRIEGVMSEIEGFRRRKAVAEANLARLKGWTDAGSDATTQVAEIRVPNPRIDELKNQIREKSQALENLLSSPGRPTESHRIVVALRNQIASLEQELASAPPTVMESSWQMPAGNELRADQFAAQAELDMCNAELDRLNALLKEYEAKQFGAGPIVQEYLQLRQLEADAEGERKDWLKKLTAVEAALNAQITEKGTRLAAVRPSPKQYRPSSPNALAVFGFAVLGGLAFGGALVFASSLLDRSITTTEELAAFLDLPICGVVGEITTSSEREARRIRRWTIGPVVGAVLALAVMISAISIGLKLYDPMKYEREWKPSPVKFIFGQVANLAGADADR